VTTVASPPSRDIAPAHVPWYLWGAALAVTSTYVGGYWVRIFVQVKRKGAIMTGAFDVAVR
jgi:hypothetical protein